MKFQQPPFSRFVLLSWYLTAHTLSGNGSVYTGGDNPCGQLGRATNNKDNSSGEFGVVTVDNTPHNVLFVDVATGLCHTVLVSGVP